MPDPAPVAIPLVPSAAAIPPPDPAPAEASAEFRAQALPTEIQEQLGNKYQNMGQWLDAHGHMQTHKQTLENENRALRGENEVLREGHVSQPAGDGSTPTEAGNRSGNGSEPTGDELWQQGKYQDAQRAYAREEAQKLVQPLSDRAEETAADTRKRDMDAALGGMNDATRYPHFKAVEGEMATAITQRRQANQHWEHSLPPTQLLESLYFETVSRHPDLITAQPAGNGARAAALGGGGGGSPTRRGPAAPVTPTSSAPPPNAEMFKKAGLPLNHDQNEPTPQDLHNRQLAANGTALKKALTGGGTEGGE